jgi:mevalonate pyrophosphate decarboxylase
MRRNRLEPAPANRSTPSTLVKLARRLSESGSRSRTGSGSAD